MPLSRRLAVAAVAVMATLAFAPSANAQGGGAEVTPCDPELVGVEVITPSGHVNRNCGPPGPAEVQGPVEHGAFVGRCSDVNPEFTSGRFVLPPSGHESGTPCE